jgi:hypothetical protein
MTTVEITPVYPAYSHPLVSWSSVILGAVTAIAVGVLLNMLVAVFDGAATMHEITKNGEAGGNGLLLGVFGGLANLVALFTGGFVAARAANHPDHHDGMLHGLAVWAVSFVVAFALLGSGASKAVGAAIGEVAATPPAATGMVSTPSGAPGDATNTMPPVTPAQQQAAEADAKADAQAEAHEIAQGATETAFWGFAAMLIGLVAALFGGILGANHPEHFDVRPRRGVLV